MSLISFFRRRNRAAPTAKAAGHSYEQARLILSASLPCLAVALAALHFAGASLYFLSFTAISLGLLISFAAILGKQRAEYHTQTLANLIEAMIDGDYTLRGRKQTNPAFQQLLSLVNQLADTLQKHKVSAQESQMLLEKVIQQMDAIIIATDDSGRVSLLNQTAQKLLPENELKSYQNNGALYLRDLGLKQLTSDNQSTTIKLTSGLYAGEYLVLKDRFISNNQPHQLFLLTRADKMLRQKEREAWQSLLRVLNHELNNSLAPITSLSGTMLRKIGREKTVNDVEKFSHNLAIIQQRTESLNAFISRYSQLSHLPAANKQRFCWREMLINLSKLFNHCEFDLQSLNSSDLNFDIDADPQQLEQVIVNLYKNSIESMAENSTPKIAVSARREANRLRISIQDNGQGIANPDNLFVPFYTTKKSGSGIGLTLCRQIMLNHDGEIRLKNREDAKGAEAELTLPLPKSIIEN